jgi:hypothetical protein
VIETGSGFSFQSKAFEVRWCGPLPKPNDLQCNDTVETLLAGSKHDPLTAPANFLKQLVIA